MMPKELLIYPPLETGMHSTYQERLGFDWIYDFMTSFNLFILEKANYWSVNFHSWDSWRVLVPTLGMHVDWVSWPTDKRLRKKKGCERKGMLTCKNLMLLQILERY